MARKFDFREDLETGLAYESIVIEAIQEFAMKSDTRDYDAEMTSITMPIEIKSDFWLHNTRNLCLEKYSSKEKKSPGGPWQSIQKSPQGTLYIIAEWTGEEPCMDNLKALYVFNSHALINFCNENKPLKIVECENGNGRSKYTTENWIYPLSELKHLAIDIFENDYEQVKPA